MNCEIPKRQGTCCLPSFPCEPWVSEEMSVRQEGALAG